MASLPDTRLVNALAAALPFTPVEKQALLEAPDTVARERLLRALMGMGLETAPESGYTAPSVH